MWRRWRRSLRHFDGLHHFAQFMVRTMEPVGGPYVLNAPSQTHQNGLTQAVSVPRRPGAVIARTIALYAQQVSSRMSGIYHRKIKEESSTANLRMNFITEGR